MSKPKPTEKSQAIDTLITKVTGIDRVASIQAQICPFCGDEINIDKFKDELSKKEFTISGLCQQCQDKVFG